MGNPDPHSYFDASQPTIRHIDFDLALDFAKRQATGFAVYTLDRPASGSLYLDTYGLEVRKVTYRGRDLAWSFDADDPILGQRLHIHGLRNESELSIDFVVSPEANALQWMEATQTSGRRHPMLYSQCQAIHARSIFPCQDSPGIRFTYDARLRVPKPLIGLMAAAAKSVDERGKERVFHFEMPQPIPSYLFALAAGEFAFREISPRCGIYAEPELIEEAAWEFAETEQMLSLGESLFGPYLWDRYDLLILPPSFPYGGMENPRLTFANAVFLSGDRSDTSLVAHELAHSWTGNLVTNATWEDFWLNEGLTTYAEYRILEGTYGRGHVELASAKDRNLLFEDFERFQPTPQFTQLKYPQKGVDPDEVFSRVPYHKGRFLLLMIEQAVGRKSFDAFIRGYIQEHAFRSLSTEAFLLYLDRELPQARQKVNLDEWIYQPGFPYPNPEFDSVEFTAVGRKVHQVVQTGLVKPGEVQGWTPDQIGLFLTMLPERLPASTVKTLDATLAMADQRRFITQSLFFALAIRSGYKEIWPRAEGLMLRSGPLLSLLRVYRAAAQTAWTKGRVRATYERARPRYHPASRAMIEAAFKELGV
jgi:leukotriene-A4 hydrolase